MSAEPQTPPQPAAQPAAPRIRFGLFELALDAGELRRSGVVVRLRQQPFKVLAFLASRPGQVISREELRGALWGGDTFVDFDQGINYCIKEVRAALGDSADAPLYIETLPRRGYRFVAPIESPAPSVLPAAVPAPAPSPASAEAPSARRAWPLTAILGVATVVLLGVVLALLLRPAPPLALWRRVSFRLGSITSARFAPGGGVVYAASWNGEAPALYAAQLGSSDARALGISGAGVVGISRGGELTYLRFAADRPAELWRAPLAGGPGKAVQENVLQAAASADGRDVAVARLVPHEGTRVEFPAGHLLPRLSGPSHLRISPDREALALIEHPRDGDDLGRVMVFDRQGQLLCASRLYASVEGLAWRADGAALFFTAAEVGSDLALRALDLSGGERLLLPAAGRLVVHDAGPDDQLLLERAVVRGQVELIDAEDRHRELSWFDASVAVALAGDGSAVLLLESGEAGGRDYAIYLRPTDGAPPLRLGSGVPYSLSPDGALALAAPLRWPDHLELLSTGPGATRELRFPGIVQYAWAAFTPGGERLVFAGRVEGQSHRLWIGDPAGGAARPLTPEGLIVRRDTISPDGTRLIGPCPPLRSCIYPLDGGAPEPIPGLSGAVPVGWAPGGDAIYVRARGRGAEVSLERLDLATGQRTPWRRIVPQDAVGVDAVGNVIMSRDGRSVAISYTRRLSELYVAGPFR